MRSASVNLLCLVLMLLAESTHQVNGGSHCPCLKTSRINLRKANIQGYMIQTAGECHIDAILFKTTRGFFCLDPKTPWVIDFLNKTTPHPISTPSNTESTLNTTG